MTILAYKMYQKTRPFWVVIATVAILSMFHSSVSLGDPVSKDKHGRSQCSPTFEIDILNPLLPIWYRKYDSYVKKCEYQLDGGKVVEERSDYSFQPDKELSAGTHTLRVVFICFDDDKGTFEGTYNTYTGKMTVTENTDKLYGLDTVENADKPNASMLEPTNGEKQRGQPSPAPANGQGAIVPPVPDKNVCDGKPPRKFTMSGRIVNAKGQGISGAKFVVLVPGTFIYEYDAFLDSSSILSQAVTDKLGNYTLSRRLRNGRKYSMFISAVGYKRYKIDERLMSTCSKSLTEKFKLRPLRY